MKNFKCNCNNCNCCDCHKYIVLRDFWLRDVMFSKGQVIGEPISKRWLELRLVAPYKSDIQFGKECAQQVALATATQVAQNLASDEQKLVEELHKDEPLTKPNEVEVSEKTVSDSDSSKTETETPKKRRGRKPKVIVEVPEKSEILLEQMIKAEVDSL